MSIESDQARQAETTPNTLIDKDVRHNAENDRATEVPAREAPQEGAEDTGDTGRPITHGYDESGSPMSEGYAGSHRPLPKDYDGTAGSATESSARPLDEADYPTGGSTEGAQPNSGATDPTPLRTRWREVQTMFVDDPRDAVTRADALVSDAIAQLTDTFAHRLQELEGAWAHEDAADTEELRQALRGYRDLFDQLMTASAGGATNM